MVLQHGMTNKLSPSPFTYLRYLICSSIAQRNVAFDKLRDTVRCSINSHSKCNLSIRGKATVLNTLIYSELWHVLRLTVFTKAQLLTIKGLGKAFINTRIFPKISFQTLSQSRANGGVGFLDPLKQQQAQQWYWLCPLLLQYLCCSPLLARYTVPSLPGLTQTLSWLFSFSTFPSFMYYFLFPTSRVQEWFPHRPLPRISYLNPLINLQSCFSVFPPHTTNDTCQVDAIPCLTLTFYETLLQYIPTDNSSSSSFIHPDLVLERHPSVKRLLVSDVFYLDPDSQVLRV
ncbi:hypothetical protein [Parasitella parasitica]|uniref:Uncharacterized protein n=1 Tax=Parasitella parasitica TaxID=35722 RepID=A0A0B7NM89_9FUNG|nr:hypothetical protein [Parasitella parasitica]